MKTMIIDTSTQLLIISFIDGDKVLYEVKQVGSNNHSDNLLSLIEKGLKKVKLEVKDFNRIIVGIGPGAYTGLRVSLTVAKMFSWTLNIPLYTMSSLDLLASGYNDDGLYAVMMKAKKDYIYGKVYSLKNKEMMILEPEMFLDKVSFLDLIKKYKLTKIVDENSINYASLKINETLLTKVSDITFLEPNYLRGEM